MRKYQKAAVVMAMLGSVSFLGAGVGHAGGEHGFDLDSNQAQFCSADDINIIGSQTGEVFAPTNPGAGLQINDLSDRHQANCAQIAGFGR